MKRITALLLAVITVLSLASCGRKVTVQVPKNKKVAILLTSAQQYPEDAMAAEELEAEFPEKIVIKQLGDSRALTPGDPEIVTAAREVAADKSIGAIVFDRATQFTSSAVLEAKKVNPDIITVCIEPERELFELEGKTDLTYIVNWHEYARDIIATAKEQGAEYFVFFSFPAHAENDLYITARENFKAYCEEQGIEYIYSETKDPIYSGGINDARKSVRENYYKLLEDGTISGENVAVFSTDSSVQSELVELTDKQGIIYVAPSFPTPYNGISEMFEVEKPEDYKDTKAYIKALKEAVKDSKGRFSAVTYTQAGTMLRGAVYAAFDMVISPSIRDNDYFAFMDNAVSRALDAAKDKKYTAITVENQPNTVYCYRPSIKIIK